MSEVKCKECGQKLPPEKLPTIQKTAVVKWVAPMPQQQAMRLALEVEGKLVLVYGYGKDLPDLSEGQRLEVTLRPDAYGLFDVVEYHLPAQVLAAVDAEAGA